MTGLVGTTRLTVAQAAIRFLARQYSERDGVERRLIAGAFGIFGHGNVAGIGQALLDSELVQNADTAQHSNADAAMPYIMGRNEQGQVHAAVAFARAQCRLQTYLCTSSVGPGALNMVTGAAVATTNRLPVLLMPGDVFATRACDPVLQQLEDPRDPGTSVNDCFRPVARFFDRINRPSQLIDSLLGAMRVLTDPAEVGAVVVSMPQDVQAEAFEWPSELFDRRVWRVRRPPAEPAAIWRAASAIRASRRPLIVAGGGVIYSEASNQLRRLAAATGIPVCDTQAGKGAINFDHYCSVGGIGATGSAAANQLAARADLVIGVGTRYSDFTTVSQTLFVDPGVRFININVSAFDAAKQSAEMIVADAREALTQLAEALGGYRVDDSYASEVERLRRDWWAETERCVRPGHRALPAQTEVLGALNELMSDDDVIINAAGSAPGDLQALWRARTPGSYHVEYAFSTMGYEIPAALGVKLARPDSEVVAILGDGSYQMAPMELATVAQEGIKVIYVLLDNHGFASIGGLSQSLGLQRFGTSYRQREHTSHLADDRYVRGVDLAANAASWGVTVIRARSVDEFRDAYRMAAAAESATVIYVETDLHAPSPPASAWWDVPVAEVSTVESVRRARADYDAHKAAQRHYLSAWCGEPSNEPSAESNPTGETR